MVTNRVLPGNLYAIKFCGINKGGEGEWGNSMIGHTLHCYTQNLKLNNFVQVTHCFLEIDKCSGSECLL